MVVTLGRQGLRICCSISTLTIRKDGSAQEVCPSQQSVQTQPYRVVYCSVLFVVAKTMYPGLFTYKKGDRNLERIWYMYYLSWRELWGSLEVGNTNSIVLALARILRLCCLMVETRVCVRESPHWRQNSQGRGSNGIPLDITSSKLCLSLAITTLGSII